MTVVLDKYKFDYRNVVETTRIFVKDFPNQNSSETEKVSNATLMTEIQLVYIEKHKFKNQRNSNSTTLLDVLGLIGCQGKEANILLFNPKLKEKFSNFVLDLDRKTQACNFKEKRV